MLLSFIIPCYGSENTIEPVISEITQVVSRRPDWAYEIICVNDGSPDRVLDVLKRLVKENRMLTVVDLAKNMGKHAAVMAGYSYAKGDYIVNLDDDGQCPMNRLWDLVDACADGHDVAMAKYPDRKESLFKRFGSNMNALMSSWLVGRPKTVRFTPFNVMRRFLIDEISRYTNPYPYLEGLTFRATHNIVSVEMEERERFSGKGGFTFSKSLSLWVNGFTAFSVKPLRFSTYVGFFVSLLGFVNGLYIIIQKLLHPETPAGYSSIMASLLFIGGLILFSLGLIGEYVGRIYICTNNSPQYVVREVLKESTDEEIKKGKEEET